MEPPKLSIIVSAFNEERHIQAVLERLAVGPYPPGEQEVIVVDDGSSDRTPAILAGWADQPGFVVRTHPANRGKGAAVRTGLALATGEVTIVQDAGLECDTADIPAVVGPILRGDFHAVFGSRYLASGPSAPWTIYRAGVLAMSGLSHTLFGTRLTDVNCCYKAVRTDLLRLLDLRCERFEFCAEVVAKLCRGGCGSGRCPSATSRGRGPRGRRSGGGMPVSSRPP